MKKFFTKSAAPLVNYGLLALLLFSVMTSTKSLLSISVAGYWVMILLAVPVFVLILILSYAAKDAKKDETRADALKLVADIVKKHNPVRRALSWIEMCIIAIALAYSGWIFTAICYVLVTLMARLILSIARDNVTAANEKAKVSEVV